MGVEALEWAAPANVSACFTTRTGGASSNAYASLNLATHVLDNPEIVARNRSTLLVAAAAPGEPVWLNQVHGTDIFNVVGDDGADNAPEFDGAYTTRKDMVLAVLVADCLPVYLCSADGNEIAVLHAGWRGLAGGVIAQGVQQFQSADLLAHIGPGIGHCHFEVDAPVKDQFLAFPQAFSQGRDSEHWQLNLQQVAQEQLMQAGVAQVTLSDTCTWCDEEKYFSARRDGIHSGRMAAMIWRR